MLTYKKAGVDIISAAAFKSKLKPLVKRSFRPEVLKDIGGFGSFFRLQKNKYKDPVLVSSCDGVGTKLQIAKLINKHDTVGLDAVAMNVNDILCVGAEPLFFLDYIAFTKVKQEILVDLVRGINDGCIESGCSLIGGETAQMPGMYRKEEYDIAGFCVGVVEKANIIDGSKIKAGDLVIGLESSGCHSNGYSLVRKVFSQSEQKRMGRELLTPTRIYVKQVLSLLTNSRTPALPARLTAKPWAGRHELTNSIRGISHITGGAFYDKISRILPDNINVRINKGSWEVPKIFKLIQNKGNVAEREMYHTLNMGIGMVLIVKPEASKNIIAKLALMKLKAWVIGEAVKGKKEVEVI